MAKLVEINQVLTFYQIEKVLQKAIPGWKSTAVHRWSPMFHRSPTGGPLRWHPQILRWPPVDHRWTTGGGTHSPTGGPPEIPQERKFCGNHRIQIY